MMSTSARLVIASLILIKLIIHTTLMLRQRRVLLQHQNDVPQPFQRLFTLKEHQKAISYGIARLHFGTAKVWFTSLILFLWLSSGALGVVDSWLFSVVPHPIWQPLCLIGLIGLVDALLGLPWSYYYKFKLEQKYGFNRSSFKLFVQDGIKATILAVVLGVVLGYPLVTLMHNIPFLWFIPAFLVYALFQLLLIWIFPTWIAPLFNRFTPLENQELTKGIEALVKQAGFNSQGVFVMDASKRSGHGNAYFTGIFKNKRIVFFDTLLEKLSSTQVLAVLAHEIGHLHFGHIRKGLALSLIFTFIGFFLLAYFGLRTDWFLELGLAPTHGSLLIVGTWVLSLITLPLAPVMNWWSRRHEFQADQYAVERTSSRDLGQALLELYRSNAGSVVVDKLYALWYYSHPPLSERLKAIGFEALTQE